MNIGIVKRHAKTAADYAALKFIETDGGIEDFSKLKRDHFTYLIVKDCIDQIRKRKEIAINNGWNVDEAMTIIEVDIQDWFDIEDIDEDPV